MSSSDKDTIYIDIDDEITGIIDKLRTSDNKVVALVLPKRAAMFQSIVNMKLLKRAADSSSKNLVLITSEAGLLPLAGAAGLHVAKTLTSKPEIPLGPQLPDDSEETIQEDGSEVELPVDPSQTIGQLAGASAAGDAVETLTLDDANLPPEAGVQPPGAKTFEPPAKSKKNKKLSIPNFERFRLLLVLGALALILLIAGLIFAATALPKAVIAIKTDATNVDTNLNLNLSTAATTLKPSDNIIPAKLAQQQKTLSQQMPTTGQKNNGSKASGSVTMTAQVCGSIPDGAPADVPSGTGVSSNGLTYITQVNTSFSSAGKAKGGCLNFPATNDTSIIAQSPGANYNGANAFTVAGRKDVTASVNTAISGGTDSIVQIVNQNDINNAKAKIATNDGDVKQTLNSQLRGDNYFPIAATYTAGTPAVTSSANVGEVANNVTVTETITYTMFGVHKEDLNALLDDNIKTQIDTSKQSILDNGLDKAVYNVDSLSATGAALSLSTTAAAGPDLDVKTIREQAAGKKAGAIKSQLQNNPDVTGVDVKLSPFWVSSVPKKTSRITVNIAKPTASTKPSTSNAHNR